MMTDREMANAAVQSMADRAERFQRALEHIARSGEEQGQRSCFWCRSLDEHSSWCPVRIATNALEGMVELGTAQGHRAGQVHGAGADV